MSNYAVLYKPRCAVCAGLDDVFNVIAGKARRFILLELFGTINKVQTNRDWLAPAA